MFDSDAAEAIIEEVALREVDLMVMATHGRGGLGRVVMGSVADATLRQGTNPMLLVRPQAGEASGATVAITVAASR